jgi:hypothetical protein
VPEILVQVASSSTGASAAHVFGFEVIGVPVSASRWIFVIPFAAITSQIGVPIGSVVALSLSVSATASAAHLIGIEVFVVPDTAGVWICFIPFTAIRARVGCPIRSVPVACSVVGSGATTAGAAVYFSIEVVIIEPSAEFVVVTLSIPVAVVTTSVSAIVGVRVVASFVFVEGNSSILIPIILASAAI